MGLHGLTAEILTQYADFRWFYRQNTSADLDRRRASMAQKLNLYRNFIKDTVPSTLLVLGQQRCLGAMLPGDKPEDIPWMKPLFGSGVDYENKSFKGSNEESPINFMIDPDNTVLGDEGVDDYHRCCSVR